MQVRIARSAEADLLQGYAFYEQQQAGIGEYFLDSPFAEIDLLTEPATARRCPITAIDLMSMPGHDAGCL